MANVRMIPATKNVLSPALQTSAGKRKVAGYARVSTDSDEQFTSFEAQTDYYTKYIKAREDWEFVAVYTEMKIANMIQFENMNPRQKARNKGF